MIQKAISSLTKGKTVIVIAHRLATIQDSDQILVIDNGRVVQQGTHRELVVQDGTYKRFIDIKESAEGWCIKWIKWLGGVMIALQFLEIVCRTKNCFWDL